MLAWEKLPGLLFAYKEAIELMKTRSDIQECLLFGRDELKYILKKIKGIDSKKHGVGVATEFDEDGLDELLYVKIMLLAGFRVTDISTVNLKESDAIIANQIRLYKGRIRLLEFIQCIYNDMSIYDHLVLEYGDRIDKEFKSLFAGYSSGDNTEVIRWKYINIGLLINWLSSMEVIRDNRIYCNGNKIDTEDEKIIKKSVLNLLSYFNKYPLLASYSNIRELRVLTQKTGEEVIDDEIVKVVAGTLSEYWSDLLNSQDIMEQIKMDMENISSEYEKAKELFLSIFNHIIDYFFFFLRDQESLFFLLKNLLMLDEKLELSGSCSD